MLAAIGDEAQKTAAAVRILAILIQMDRKFLNSTRQNGHLDLRRARIGVVAARFADFVLLFTLRKHPRMVSHSRHLCKVLALHDASPVEFYASIEPQERWVQVRL